MAKYTITIKNLIDNKFDFGLTTYPIFDESYRNTLNEKIIAHYYENEIGFETANLFKFYLNNRLNEIMPYYNELYKVQKKIIDQNLLLNNVNLTETLSGSNSKQDSKSETSQNATTNNTTTTGTSQSASTSSGNSNSKNLFQDTPQGTISSTDIDAQTWATNLTLDRNTTQNAINDSSNSSGTAQNTINGSTNNSGTYNTNGTNNYLKSIIGNNGNKFNIDILNDIKNNLMNIDMMIINDLNELFMQIY